MKIVVLVKMVPDLVEELTIDETGKAIDVTWLRLILNEFDNHALEQGILLKEALGGEVIVIAPEAEGVEEVLFTAAASGANRLIKLTGLEGVSSSHALARACFPLVQEMAPDVILTGVQAHDDLDGQVGPLLAAYLQIPYVGYIAGLSVENGRATARKEFPGGVTAEMDIVLPGLIGIQAAQEPPRYVAFSRVRQARTTAVLEEISVDVLDSHGGPEVMQMSQPEIAERAEMLAGDPDKVASELLRIFRQEDIL